MPHASHTPGVLLHTVLSSSCMLQEVCTLCLSPGPHAACAAGPAPHPTLQLEFSMASMGHAGPSATHGKQDLGPSMHATPCSNPLCLLQCWIQPMCCREHMPHTGPGGCYFLFAYWTLFHSFFTGGLSWSNLQTHSEMLIWLIELDELYTSAFN